MRSYVKRDARARVVLSWVHGGSTTLDYPDMATTRFFAPTLATLAHSLVVVPAKTPF